MQAESPESGNESVEAILVTQRRFIGALLDLGHLTLVTTDDDGFYQQLLERVVDVVPGAEGGSIQLAIPNTSEFRFVSAVGFDLQALQERVLDKRHFFRDALDPRAQIVRNFKVESRTAAVDEWLERAGRTSEIKSNVSAPVVVNGSTVAFLSIDNFSDRDAFTEYSAEMITVLARLIGNLYLRRCLEFEQEQRSAELHRRATTDGLTGISNRSQILQTLDATLQAAERPAVLFCDLDNFKAVNDSHGHTIGDLLIAAVAERLKNLWTNESAFLGRLGGDEFLIVLPHADIPGAVDAAEAILDAMKVPFSVGGCVLHAGMCVGVAASEPDQLAATSAQLLQQADTALYEAKARGVGQCAVFDQEMRDTMVRRRAVEQEVRDAIDTGGIVTYFQPIVELVGGSIIGVEALARLRAADGKIVPPSGFLEDAKAAGLLPTIGRMVLRDALELGAAMGRSGVDLELSVNVSAQELQSEHFVEGVLEAIEDSSVDPDHVVLEITESSVINSDAAFGPLERLRSHGIRIALDDFGTGYSSLAHLRTLPIDRVKVDRSFLRDLLHDERTYAITRSLLMMCEDLHLNVVLEGVETREEAVEARRLGGKFAQGYFFHRPMPSAQLVDTFMGDTLRNVA